MKEKEQGKQFEISEEEFLKEIEKMEVLELEELEKIVAEAEKSPHQFSKEFEAWKEEFIREKENEENAATSETAKGSFIYSLINTPLKKAAVVAVIVGAVALAAGSGASMYAGKNPIVKFFQEKYEEYIEIEPHKKLWKNKEKPLTIEKEYEFGWLPDGYEKEIEENLETVFVQIYKDGKSDTIQLEQYCVYMYFAIKEEDGYEEVKYKGNKYYYLTGEDEMSVVWYKDGYQFILRGNRDLDEMLEIADNVEQR